MNDLELLELASGTPPSPAGIVDLAHRLPPGNLAPLVDRALTELRFPAALALLLAQAEAGRAIDIRQVTAVAPFVDRLEEFIVLVGRASGPRVEALLDLVESRRFGEAGDVVALFLAAHLNGEAPPPPRLLTWLRQLGRMQLLPENGEVLGLAAAQVEDTWVAELCASSIKLAAGRPAQDVRRNLLDLLAGPPSRILLAAAAGAEADGLPVQRTEAKVGRNDPCPCGSGRKYKKCCEGKDGQSTAEYAATPEALSPERLARLRPHQLAALDFARLGTAQVVEAVRTLSIFRLWQPADRAIAALEGRDDLEEGSGPDDLRITLLHDALLAGDVEAARAQVARMRDPASVNDVDRLALDLTAPTADTLRSLEAVASRMLQVEDPYEPFDFAHVVMRSLPALGALIARGTIDPRLPAESQAAMEAVEAVRDRLLLSPDDPGWANYDAILRDSMQGAPASPDEKLAAEAEDLRARSAEAAARAAEMERRMRQVEQDLAKARLQAEAAAVQTAPVDPAAVQRLRAKVEEYEGQIAEGNRERQTLRRQLSDMNERLTRPAALARAEAPEPPKSDPEEQEGPRPERMPVLLPAFAKAAEDSLRDQPPPLAREALRSAALLAGGDPHAWEQVKRLRRLSDVWSARVGIHHRLLFRVDAEQRRLLVLDFINRKELEATLQRWR